MSSTVLSDFSANLQKVLEDAIATKTAELDKREKDISAREHRCATLEKGKKITLVVGQDTFFTHSDVQPNLILLCFHIIQRFF